MRIAQRLSRLIAEKYEEMDRTIALKRESRDADAQTIFGTNRGKAMTDEWLKIVLRDGRQRQRAAAALELAIRQPGQPLFNVAAPGFRQIERLGKPGPVIR